MPVAALKRPKKKEGEEEEEEEVIVWVIPVCDLDYFGMVL